MARRPDVRIDVEPVAAHHHDRRHFLALVARQPPVRHRRQPDVGVEPDLMAGMSGEHRAAARLRHVADQQSRPAGVLLRLVGQPLQQRDQVGMRPVAVARQPHHLPGLAVDRQRLARRRCSPWRRSRSRASASPPADLRPNNSLAASLGSLGLASGGSGLGSTVPLSCASARAAAMAEKRGEESATNHAASIASRSRIGRAQVRGGD